MRIPPGERLLTRLLLGTLVPTVLVLLAFGVLAHEVARRVLEDELGRRLALAAAGAAGMILPEQLAALESSDERPGGDAGTLTRANIRRKLLVARQRFDVRRVAVVSPALFGRGDTDDRVAYGAPAHELGADRLELGRAARGSPTTSPLFEGHDGLLYKRGYAAIADVPDGEARGGGDGRAPTSSPALRGFVVVEASADYLVALRVFRRRLMAGGVAALVAVLVFTSLLARRVSRPVVELASAAARIGRGDLDQPVVATTTDEVGFLAETLDGMRAALKARDERLQMMLAGIAHEVRNPLGGLELYAGLLRDSLQDQPERLEELRRIDRELGYLKRVVTEFLDYARRPPVQLTSIPIAGLLQEVAEMASTDGVRVTVEAPPRLRVCADEMQLRRAFLNLATNAVAASSRTAHPSGAGQVTLRAEAVPGGPGSPGPSGGSSPGGAVRVQIDDDGPGVDPDLRQKIFTPFFTTREKGTGLGLAFVREIVQDHHSEISVGDRPGGGARFELVLPAGAPQPPSP